MPFQIILLKVHYASDIVFCGSITLITIYTHREIHDVSACTHYVYMYGRQNSGRKNSILTSIDFDEILYNTRLYTTLNVQTPFNNVRYPDQGVLAR